MTNEKMMEVADESGTIKAHDYHELKILLEVEKAERLEFVKQNPEMASMILSLAGQLMATKRKPENMARKQKGKVK